MNAFDFDFSRSEWQNMIDEWIFDKTMREMLKLNLLDGLTYGEIAEKLNLSIDKVSKNIRKSKKYLFSHCQK